MHVEVPYGFEVGKAVASKNGAFEGWGAIAGFGSLHGHGTRCVVLVSYAVEGGGYRVEVFTPDTLSLFGDA